MWSGEKRNRRSAAPLKRNVKSQGGSLDEREVRTEERERERERREASLFIAGAGERAQRHGSDARTQRQRQ